MSEKEKVILYLAPHSKGEDFLEDPFGYLQEIKSVLLEAANGMSGDDIVKFLKTTSPKHLSYYSQKRQAFVLQALKRKIDIHNGEYTTNKHYLQKLETLQERMSTIDSAYKHTVPPTPLLETYFKNFAAFDSLRNNIVVENLENTQKPTLIRLGTAHSLIRKVLDYSRYEIETVLTPFVMNYYSEVIRKYQLGKDVSEEELIKGWVTKILNNDSIMKNLTGKVEYDNNYKDDNFKNIIMRELINSYEGDLSALTSHNVHLLCTSQGLKDPRESRVPMKDIRSFIQKCNPQLRERYNKNDHIK